MAKKFPSEFSSRGTVKLTDKLLIQNIDTGVDCFTTVAELLAVTGTIKYWSCNGIHFNGINPATDNIIKSTSGYLRAASDNITLVAAVTLPHGATVTSVIVTGNAAASNEEYWLVLRGLSDLTPGTLIHSYINARENSINLATIDNSLYSYLIYTTSLDTNDEIWGAEITYTL
jgi:hypothetical protein